TFGALWIPARTGTNKDRHKKHASEKRQQERRKQQMDANMCTEAPGPAQRRHCEQGAARR
ncbi:MAG: hypothetical protein ACPIOQ_64150, partial [Promethearchaeia archaeon]